MRLFFGASSSLCSLIRQPAWSDYPPYACQTLQAASGHAGGAVSRDQVSWCQQQINKAISSRPNDVINAADAAEAQEYAAGIRKLWVIVEGIKKNTGVDLHFPEEKVKEVERLAEKRAADSRVAADASRAFEIKPKKEFQPPSSLDASLGGGLDSFFAVALESDPTRRPASAGEFLAAFESAILG